MPSYDEIKPQSQRAANDDVAAQTPVADVEIATPVMSELAMSQEFTFFRKKKRLDDVTGTPALPYAGAAKMTAFFARLDSALAANSKTQRHIADLQTLMADVALTLTSNVPKPVRKTSQRSKWWFYVCLAIFGLGWFLLFPSGRNLLTQLVGFLAR